MNVSTPLVIDYGTLVMNVSTPLVIACGGYSALVKCISTRAGVHFVACVVCERNKQVVSILGAIVAMLCLGIIIIIVMIIIVIVIIIIVIIMIIIVIIIIIDIIIVIIIIIVVIIIIYNIGMIW